LALKAKGKSCLIIRESCKGRPAGIPVRTTPKVLSSAPEIRVGTTTIKHNAPDNKDRGATNIITNRGTTLRPIKGLVVNNKIVKKCREHTGQEQQHNYPVQPNGCFKCGELGHYANNCPRRNQQTPQKNSNQKTDQNTPARGSAQNKTPQNQSRGRVNHVTAESVPDDADVVYGMFLINSIHASVLFDSRASHSFVTSHLWKNIIYQTIP
jgi:hypothetical protein